MTENTDGNRSGEQPVEPKLLDAEAFEQLWRLTDSPTAMQAFLRERGLIAPEPVDPRGRLIEEIIDAYHTTRTGKDFVPHILSFDRVQSAFAKLAPAAKPLTREMVEKVMVGWCGPLPAHEIDYLFEVLTQVQP